MKVAGTNKPEGKGYISAGCSAACLTRSRTCTPSCVAPSRWPLEGLPLPIRRPLVRFPQSPPGRA